jgi:hypothetical protein
MQVYADCAAARNSASFTIVVKPGEHPESDPAEWWDAEKKVPVQFSVKFVFGRAVVPDALGKWMLAKKMASKTALVMSV